MGKTKRDIHMQIGNAVPGEFAKVLADNIKKALECLDEQKRFTEQLEQCADFWQLSLF
jgi:DNA (cytosine-5)-methyltransferase 1